MRKLLFVPQAFLGMIISTHVGASEFSMVAPMKSFAIFEPTPPPSGVPSVYSATVPRPQWAIAQWNIPNGKLSDFAQIASHELFVLKTEAKEAGVTLIREPDGLSSAQLTQDLTSSPCSSSGQPREADLFLSTNGEAGMSTESKTFSLADLNSLSANVTLTASTKTNSGARCEINEVTYVIGLALDTKPPAPLQTMFYQLSVGHFCGRERPERAAICLMRTNRPVYFSTKNPFGADDISLLSSFEGDREKKVQVNLLPRLIESINEGPVGMDKNIQNWYVSGVYIGQVSYGDVRAESMWRSFGLRASTK